MGSGTFVRPICMPHLEKADQIGIRPLHPFTKAHQVEIDYPHSEYLRISGFGKTNRTNFENVHDLTMDYWQIDSKELLKAYVGALQNDECQARIKEGKGFDLNISSEQICAMGLPASEQNADTCQGDSGGPLVKLVEVFEEKAHKLGWSFEKKAEEMLKAGN